MQTFRLGQVANKRTLRRLPVVLALLITGGCVSATSAWAQGPSVIVKVHQVSGLISPYFQLSGSPGHPVTAGALELVNPTSGSVTVRVDPVDAVTTNTLGSAYAMTNAGIHGATTWLRLGARKVTLAPHASQRVSVSLTVPPSAGPGDYLTGVSVEALGQTQSTSASRGLAIGEIDRYAIGVELKLPGPRHPVVHLTGASVAREPRGLEFLVGASNPSNVILKAVHGWIRVTDGNRVVATTTIQPGTFVSGTTISYPLLASREQPAPGASYHVRAALYYPGGVAHLDTSVRFSHAAAVTQQNYGGRKLPESTLPWRWLVLVVLLLGLGGGIRWEVRRRRRPISRTSGLRLLERSLAPTGELPVSILLVSGPRRVTEMIATAIRPRLRRSDRVCDLGHEGLLVICPATSRSAATALRRDINEHLARHRELADLPIEVTASTAMKPTTARKMLERVNATRERRGRGPARGTEPQITATHE